MKQICVYCEMEFDREELTDLCDLCYENVLFCEECGEYVMDDEYDEDTDMCVWCKEKAIAKREANIGKLWARLGVSLDIDARIFNALSDQLKRKTIVESFKNGKFCLNGETIVYNTDGVELFESDL